MIRVAYATPETCGSGHAVRGIALVRAGKQAGIDVRAFGPPVPYPALMASGYEGTDDWRERVVAFGPDLLLSDVGWIRLDDVRERLQVPAWALLRWMPPGWLASRVGLQNWRRISIEPAADGMAGITDSIPPIVVCNPSDIRPGPYDDQDVTLGSLHDPTAPFPVGHLLTRARSIVSSAGSNAYWEAVWLGYRDRVRWLSEPAALDRVERLRVGGEMTANGGAVLMQMIASA
jgi:hypothetical protein